MRRTAQIALVVTLGATPLLFAEAAVANTCDNALGTGAGVCLDYGVPYPPPLASYAGATVYVGGTPALEVCVETSGLVVRGCQ